MSTVIRGHRIAATLSTGRLAIDVRHAESLADQLAEAWNNGDHSFATTRQIFQSSGRWTPEALLEPITYVARKLGLILTA